MPTYEYLCDSCGFEKEEVHSMKENPVFSCPECQTAMTRQISLPGFIIKGGTPAMDWKEERYRMKRSNDMGVRQIERWGGGQRALPNVAGIETDSWSDAAKLAKEAGINTATYEPMIEKEKRTSKTSGIDDAAWKKAKEVKASS
jgi:putative FmdB family regulatory protein